MARESHSRRADVGGRNSSPARTEAEFHRVASVRKEMGILTFDNPHVLEVGTPASAKIERPQQPHKKVMGSRHPVYGGIDRKESYQTRSDDHLACHSLDHEPLISRYRRAKRSHASEIRVGRVAYVDGCLYVKGAFRGLTNVLNRDGFCLSVHDLDIRGRLPFLGQPSPVDSLKSCAFFLKGCAP